MNKHFTLLFVVLVAFQTVKTDILEDATLQLSNLRALVLGNIQVAHDNFAGYYSDITSYSNNVITLGDMSINEVYAEVSAQLIQIKDLAQSANKDISYCTGGREQMINKLPDELKGRLETCVINQNEEAATVLDSSGYLVDIIMSRVHSLEFQLNICADDTCITPLLTEIEAETVQLPLQIKLQINQAKELIDELKVIVGECHDNNVADFTGYVTDLITQIADCANKIIG